MSGILAAVLMRDADLEATPRAFGRCCDSVWPAKLGSALATLAGRAFFSIRRRRLLPQWLRGGARSPGWSLPS